MQYFWLHPQYLCQRYEDALNGREPPKHKAQVLKRSCGSKEKTKNS